MIGDVLSGKTATYIGAVNEAVDAGYKLVVLLAGGTRRHFITTQICELTGAYRTGLLRGLLEHSYPTTRFSELATGSITSSLPRVSPPKRAISVRHPNEP